MASREVLRVYVLVAIEIDPLSLEDRHPSEVIAVNEIVEKGREYGHAKIVEYTMESGASPLNPQKPMDMMQALGFKQGMIAVRSDLNRAMDRISREGTADVNEALEMIWREIAPADHGG